MGCLADGADNPISRASFFSPKSFGSLFFVLVDILGRLIPWRTFQSEIHLLEIFSLETSILKYPIAAHQLRANYEALEKKKKRVKFRVQWPNKIKINEKGEKKKVLPSIRFRYQREIFSSSYNSFFQYKRIQMCAHTFGARLNFKVSIRPWSILNTPTNLSLSIIHWSVNGVAFEYEKKEPNRWMKVRGEPRSREAPQPHIYDYENKICITYVTMVKRKGIGQEVEMAGFDYLIESEYSGGSYPRFCLTSCRFLRPTETSFYFCTHVLFFFWLKFVTRP